MDNALMDLSEGVLLEFLNLWKNMPIKRNNFIAFKVAYYLEMHNKTFDVLNMRGPVIDRWDTLSKVWKIMTGTELKGERSEMSVSRANQFEHPIGYLCFWRNTRGHYDIIGRLGIQDNEYLNYGKAIIRKE
jgi:hypothetical protein